MNRLVTVYPGLERGLTEDKRPVLDHGGHANLLRPRPVVVGGAGNRHTYEARLATRAYRDLRSVSPRAAVAARWPAKAGGRRRGPLPTLCGYLGRMVQRVGNDRSTDGLTGRSQPRAFRRLAGPG